MKNKLALTVTFLMSFFVLLAQTPREIKQVDKKQVNFWESMDIIIITVVLVIVLIIARKWSSKILKKRDEVIEKEEK